MRLILCVGIGGNGLIRSRPNDTFSAGYFYLGASDDFKNLFNGPILGQRGELFYNFAVTPGATSPPTCK